LVAHFYDLFHGDHDLFDVVAHFLGLDALFDALFDLLLLAGESMNDEPLATHGCWSWQRNQILRMKNKRIRIWSTATVKPPNIRMAMKTIKVEPLSSSQLGQLHLRSSSRVART